VRFCTTFIYRSGKIGGPDKEQRRGPYTKREKRYRGVESLQTVVTYCHMKNGARLKKLTKHGKERRGEKWQNKRKAVGTKKRAGEMPLNAKKRVIQKLRREFKKPDVGV